MPTRALLACTCLLLACRLTAHADNWPSFRGPDGTGVAPGNQPLPVDLNPTGPSLAWRTPLPAGHSTPVVWEDHLFVTAYKKPKLVTVCLDATSGKLLWERNAPYKKLEGFHRVGSPATPSVATDGEHVYSFFGSSGLYCYDMDGRQPWFRPLGPFQNDNGATCSPLVVDDRILMIQDHETGSHVVAYDKRTGTEIWKTDRPDAKRNYCSPIVWTVNGRRQVVVSGSAQVKGYDFENGEPLWTIRGVSRVVDSTPLVGPDGVLYVAATGGGDAAGQPAFDELLSTADADKDGFLSQAELPKSLIKNFFGQFDKNGDKKLDKEEYESIRAIFDMARTVAMAVKPGGRGDITDSHVVWALTRGIPRNASPLLYRGYLYLVKDGGVLTVIEAKTGSVAKQLRLPGRGKYFSSPAAGDGKLYFASDRGQLSVLSAKDWQILGSADLKEDCFASLAIANGRLYVRTAQAVYCFAKPK